jgi:hypothetical protein
MNVRDNVRQWVVLDNQHKKANEQVKVIRDAKNTLGNSIISDLAANNIHNPKFNISDGNLRLVETKQANVISYKFLLECFNEYLEDENKADELLEFVKNKRTFTNASSIKRFYNKE